MRRFLTLSIVVLLLLGTDVGLAVALPALQAVPPITAYVPDTLPLENSNCFRIEGDGVLDFPALVARFPGVPNAADDLRALGWQEGASRQFAGDAPRPGHAGWIDLSIHHFGDAASASAAVPFFADSRALDMHLQVITAPPLGDRTAAVVGPASNGNEYTLYASRGSWLIRVTGVAPTSGPLPSALPTSLPTLPMVVRPPSTPTALPLVRR